MSMIWDPQEMHNSIQDLRKLINTTKQEHYNRHTSLQAVVIQHEMVLTRLNRVCKIICVAGSLLAVIVLLLLIEWF